MAYGKSMVQPTERIIRAVLPTLPAPLREGVDVKAIENRREGGT
jgi:hypothetical protein